MEQIDTDFVLSSSRASDFSTPQNHQRGGIFPNFYFFSKFSKKTNIRLRCWQAQGCFRTSIQRPERIP